MTGLSAALVSTLFSYASIYGRYAAQHHPWLVSAATPFIAMTLAWLTLRVFKYSEGSGIPQVIATLTSHQHTESRAPLLSWRSVLGKLCLAPIALITGMSLGREGPTVQIGASIMYAFRRVCHYRSEFWDKAFIMAGGAAGLAAAFQAPIAGVVFAIEELTAHFWKRMVLLLLLVIAIALEIVNSFHSDTFYFGHVVTQPSGWHLLPAVLLVASVAGLASGCFNRLVLLSRSWQIKAPLRLAFFCGLVIALINIATHNTTFGDGREPAYALLHGISEPQWYYSIAKWLTTLFTYLCVIPGGLFSPSLSISAGLATLLHPCLATVPLPELALLGMAAYIAGLTQSPITALVITLEMTGGAALATPLVAAAFIGAEVAKQIAPGLYETIAKRRYSPITH